jgi:hypothetical protein
MERQTMIIFKKVLRVFGVLLICFGIFYVYNFNREPLIIETSAKINGVKNLSELEGRAELIIKGTKVEGKPEFNLLGSTEEGTDEDFHTNTLIKIEELFFDKKDTFQKGDTITIEEPAAAKRNLLTGRDQYFTYEEYELMEDGKQYILFLRESLSSPGRYVLISHNLGVYALDSKNYQAKNKPHQTLQVDVFNKYNK